MIAIKNTQRKIKIDQQKLQKTVAQLLNALDYPDFDLGIWLTTNKTIRAYNKAYRNKDKPTDILSFAYYPDLKPGKRIKVKSDDDKNLGDLLLSLEYIKHDAPNWHQTFEERLLILLVHGLCHLLGYDHESDSDYRVMKKEEDRLLKIIADKS